MSLEGGWTLRNERDIVVPVVPADDAAVERLAQHLYAEDGKFSHANWDRWKDEPATIAEECRDRARECLRVLAGETP